MYTAELNVKMFASAVDNAYAIHETDLQGIIIYVNDLFCDFTGYLKEEVIGKNVNILRSPLTPYETYSELWISLKMEIPWKGEFINRRKDGSVFFAESLVLPVYGETKEVHSYRAIWRDSQHFYENSFYSLLTFNKTNTSMLVIIETGDITYANKDFLDFFGLQNHQFPLALDFLLLTIKENGTYAKAEMLLKFLLMQDRNTILKVMMENHQKEIKIFKLSRIEHLNFSIFNFEDITHDENMEQFLLQQSRLAEMGEMIGNIAHQWRQPLNAIGLNMAEISLDSQFEGSVSQEKVQELVTKVNQQVNFLSKTIDDFRNFFIENKQSTPFTMESCIELTLGLVEKTLQANNIKMVINTSSHDPFLENTKNESTILGCPNEINQVLLNIINNSKDAFISKNTEDRTITISVEKPKNNYITTRIRDNAGGIPMDILPYIFDPYYTTKHKSQGTGIGLYMSKTIIEKHHNGTLKAFNHSNGVIFEITLPLFASAHTS